MISQRDVLYKVDPMHKHLFLCALPFLTACSVTVPAEVRTEDGEVFTGSATATLRQGTFSVANESGVTCTGFFDPVTQQRRLRTPVTCTDGRQGMLDIVRDVDLAGGVGTAVLEDGTKATVVFGEDNLAKSG